MMERMNAPSTRAPISGLFFALLAWIVGPGLACSPGEDGAWTVVDQGLAQASLRAVRVGEDGGVWAAGYHGGRLSGILLHGAGEVFEEVPLPSDLTWDFAFVDVCHLDDGVIWLAATAHLLRLADGDWTVVPVPGEIADGVTACAFTADGVGLVLGQSWDGPRFYAFAEGEFAEEPLMEAVERPDELSLASVLARSGFGYAAGVRRADEQEAVLLIRRGEGWDSVDLPDSAADIGPIRDLAWHAGGPDIWAVGDRILTGDAGQLEVVDFPYRDDFTPRVVAFPGAREGWIAGFGEDALVHERFGIWEAVPGTRLAADLAEGSTRTWLFDDADFPQERSGWLVAEYSDCPQGSDCQSGQAILRYDRDASTSPWSVDASWVAPANEGEAAPALRPSAVAEGPDGSLWLAGDSDPDGTHPWGLPQLWRRPPGGDWGLEGGLSGIEIRDLHLRTADSGWAVGARAGAADDDSLGVLLRLEGGEWIEESADDVVASDWELYAVAEAPDGDVYAAGRRNHFPLVLVRDGGSWSVVDVDEFEGITAVRDLAVDGDGTVWVVGTSILGSGGTTGYVAVGDRDGLQRLDLVDVGRQCGAVDHRAPCWSLRAVAAKGDEVSAVGEATALTFRGGQIEQIPTNMTLLDVAYSDADRPWILAENGWWQPSGGGWTVQRHWDAQAGEGIVRRLVSASDGFGWLAGFRQRSEDEGGDLLHAILVRPEI